jgi:hypothetical protein
MEQHRRTHANPKNQSRAVKRPRLDYTETPSPAPRPFSEVASSSATPQFEPKDSFAPAAKVNVATPYSTRQNSIEFPRNDKPADTQPGQAPAPVSFTLPSGGIPADASGMDCSPKTPHTALPQKHDSGGNQGLDLLAQVAEVVSAKA